MRVLGVDPGYGRVGLAILEEDAGRQTLVHSECLEPDTEVPFAEKLSLLSKRVGRLCREYKPKHVALEKLFFSKNQKTALRVAEARGVVLAAAAAQGLAIYEYAPREIKLAVTGSGASDKSQVAHMVHKLVPINKTITHDDEYDAIAVSLTHLASYKTRG